MKKPQPNERKNKPLTEKEKNDIYVLYDAGHTYYRISKTINRSENAVKMAIVNRPPTLPEIQECKVCGNAFLDVCPRCAVSDILEKDWLDELLDL